jgi:bifunctional non-homologous end joining protein LigD
MAYPRTPSKARQPLAIGVRAKYPGFIPPALATLVSKVPSGELWLHEVKFDGYRVQLHVVNEAVKIFTRRGRDWTPRFKKIADDAWHLNFKSAIIDGEVITPDAKGLSDFSVLQKNCAAAGLRTSWLCTPSIYSISTDTIYNHGRDWWAHCRFQ